MSLTNDINNLIQKSQKVTSPTTSSDVSRAPKRNPNYEGLMARYQVEQERVAWVKRARTEYDEDPRASDIIDTLARDAVKNGFQLEVNNPRAAAIIDSLRTRLKLDMRLDDWGRLTFRDGDSFLELGVTADGEIALVTRKPTLGMHRNSDSSDRFVDPRLAYWYGDAYQLSPNKETLWFADWQIIHARWHHDEGNRYGRPLLHSGRKVKKKVDEGEMDAAIRRKTRAGMRLLHYVEGDANDVEAYKELNKVALDDPFSAHADFFTNKPGGITSLQGDANLGNMEDILHHLDTWFLSSPVPKGILGYGRDLNRDVLDEQKEQYDESIAGVQTWFTTEILTPLFELQWLLAGILPETLTYKITWGNKAVITPDSILKIMQAANAMKVLGIPIPVIASVVARFLPNVTPEMLIDGMMSLNTTNEAERLNMIATSLQKTLTH